MAIGSSGPVSADTDGWTVGALGGLNIIPHLTPQSGLAEKYDSGAAAILQGGYEIDQVTLEGEVSWRGNDVGKVSQSVTSIGTDYRFPSVTVTTLTSHGQGAINVGAVMANLYYSLETGTKLTPYLGGGLGDARVSQSRVGAAGAAIGNLDGTAFAFAYQGIAGLSCALDRKISIKAEYRYFRTSDIQFDQNQPQSGSSNREIYRAQSMLLGLTYRF